MSLTIADIRPGDMVSTDLFDGWCLVTKTAQFAGHRKPSSVTGTLSADKEMIVNIVLLEISTFATKEVSILAKVELSQLSKYKWVRDGIPLT